MKSSRHSKSSTRKDFKRQAGSRFRRARTLEMLEGRVLLAGDTAAAIAPYHNRFNARDVNFDNRVSATDALYVISDLLNNGPRTLPQIAVPLTAGGSSGFRYVDVTGDNRVTPHDALLVINQLLATTQMDVTSNIKDLGGNPISSIDVGQSFLIEVVVQDVRDPVSDTPGVFSAFVNLNYDPNLIEIAQQTPDAGPDFQVASGQELDLSTPGFIPGFLVISGLTPRPNNNPQQLFTLVATAKAGGVANVSPSFDTTPASDMLLYPDVLLTESEIQFTGTSVTINAGTPTVSVSDVTLSEGNSGTTPFIFTVSLSSPAQSDVTVAYSTQDGTATQPSDYAAVSGTLTFAAGQSTQLVTVLVNGDITPESDETFTLNLSNPIGATLADATGVGTIVTDDAIPTLAVSSVSKAEGNSGTTDFVFTVSLSSATNAPVVVAYNTANVTAVAPGDYAAQSGTLTFAVGETTKVITVAVAGDTETEDNETFAVQVARVSGTLANDNAAAVGTILNDEGQLVVVRLQVTDLAGNPLPVGTSLNPNDTFLLRAYVQDLQSTPQGIGLAFVDITYDPNLVALNGPAVFGPNFPNSNTQGDTSTPGLIDEIGALGIFPAPSDLGAESVLFSVPFRALAAGVANFGVDPAEPLDNQIRFYTVDTPVPLESINFAGTQLLLGANTVSIADNSVTEGNAGTTNLVFTLSRFLPTDSVATVVYATSDGSATTGDGDYVGASGTVTFAPGQASQQITVVVNGDTKNELNESFTLTLSSPSGATLGGQSVALGTIFNDDGVPSLSIGNANGNEGTNLQFTVTLSEVSGQNVLVPFNTVGGSAGSGTDFTATSGTLTFLPGQTQRTISVAALADGVLDPSENFTVVLGTPINATVAQGTGTGTIGDVAPVVTFSVPSRSIAEGNAGTSNLIFTASLSTATTLPVVAVYGTSNGTAIGGTDYFATSGTLTFLPGETTKLITVQVVGDTVVEPNESFSLTLAGASGPFTGAAVVATGTIDNDDGVPAFSVSDALGIGPLAGNGSVVFTVSLAPSSATPVVVGYATQDFTALAGVDYVFQSGNLTFAAGETVKTVTVPTIGQPDPSEDETFFLNLSSPSGGATINDGTGVGTIARRGIRIDNVSVVEGNSGQQLAVFTLSLDDPAVGQVTVQFNTVDGTATTADNDYLPTSGTATFAPGVSYTTVMVPILGDTTVEGDETFALNLHTAVGDVVIVGNGTGTIQNDDGQTARFRLQLKDSNGIVVGPGDVLDPLEAFTLEVYVQDVRQTPTGIFQAFVDVVYNQAIVAVNGAVEWGPRFVNDRQGNTSTPGLFDEMGAFADALQPPAPGGEDLFFSVPMRATNLGVAEFSTNEADGPEHVVLTYLNDDPVSTGLIFFGTTSVNVGQNVVAISSVSQSEGNSGESDFVFTLTRVLPNDQPAVVTYHTADQTAHVSDGDYVATSGTLTFGFGELTKFVTVKVKGDLKDEIDEMFQLVLEAGENTNVGTPGIGTIVDDDGPVSVSVSDGSASEGQSMTFTVTLSAVSGRNVFVPFFTQSGSAVADLDFQSVNGTLSFAPGQTQKTVTVLAYEDTKSEGNETFQLVLHSTTNAVIGDGSGQGTIVDIPPAALSGFVYVDLNNNGIKDPNESGLAGVTVVAEHSNGYSKAVLTEDDGSYFIDELIAGSYTLTEIQPGFFSDGRDTRFGVEAALNDKFTGITLAPSEHESGYHFGERGVRAEFVSAFINRRAFFASAIVTGEWGGQIGTLGAVNPKSGDVWISFDAGWFGQRTIDAMFDTNQGGVTMKLYNNNMQEVASSFNAGAGHSQLIYNGNTSSPLFLKVSGSNNQVAISVTPPVQTALFQASLDGGTPSGATFRSGTLASGAPSAGHLTSPDGDDLVWSEDEDWLN